MSKQKQNVTRTAIALAAMNPDELFAATKAAGRIELHFAHDGESVEFVYWPLGDRPDAFVPEGIGEPAEDKSFVVVTFIGAVPPTADESAVTVMQAVNSGDPDVCSALLQTFGDKVNEATTALNKPLYRNAVGGETKRKETDVRFIAVDDGGMNDIADLIGWNEVNAIDVNVWAADPQLVVLGTEMDGDTLGSVFATADMDDIAHAAVDAINGKPLTVAIAKDGSIARVIQDGDGTALEVKLAGADDFTTVPGIENATAVRIRTTEHGGPTYLYAYDGKGQRVYVAELNEQIATNALQALQKPAGVGDFHGVAEDRDGMSYLVFAGLTASETDGDKASDAANNPAGWTLLAPDFAPMEIAQAAAL